MHKTGLYYGSLAIVLAANLGYHLVSRSIPVGGNQFLGIAGAYLLASVLCFLAGVLTRKGPLLKEWKETPLHYLLFGLFVLGRLSILYGLYRFCRLCVGSIIHV